MRRREIVTLAALVVLLVALQVRQVGLFVDAGGGLAAVAGVAQLREAGVTTSEAVPGRRSLASSGPAGRRLAPGQEGRRPEPGAGPGGPPERRPNARPPRAHRDALVRLLPRLQSAHEQERSSLVRLLRCLDPAQLARLEAAPLPETETLDGLGTLGGILAGPLADPGGMAAAPALPKEVLVERLATRRSEDLLAAVGELASQGNRLGLRPDQVPSLQQALLSISAAQRRRQQVLQEARRLFKPEQLEWLENLASGGLTPRPELDLAILDWLEERARGAPRALPPWLAAGLLLLQGALLAAWSLTRSRGTRAAGPSRPSATAVRGTSR